MSAKRKSAAASSRAVVINGNIDELVPKLESIGKGERVVYHQGYLVRDRKTSGMAIVRNSIAHVADAALALCEAGRVKLIQRKHGDFDYDYIAVGA